MDVLEDIKNRVDIPLVLHGGSANPDEEIAKAVQIGIQKVNISSDYKYAFYKNVAKFFRRQNYGMQMRFIQNVLMQRRRLLSKNGIV